MDIFLSKSNLYVGHHWLDLKNDKTIQKMYLDPLWKIYLDNKSIYGNSTLYLLVDVKTSALKTYKLLEDILNKYKPMLTHVSLDSLYIGPVTIILSGNRPPINYFDDYHEYRNVFIDGRINDVGRMVSEKIMHLISSDWGDSFEWDGKGIMSEDEKKILRELVIKIHNEKKEIRFWGAPDNQNTWKALLSAGVDLINTDNIEECRNFIIQQGKY